MRTSRKRRIFITGAANGIGKEIATRAVERGHRVVLSDIDLTGAQEVASALGHGSSALQLDVSSEEGWARALDEAWRREGKIDVLINNAGIVHPGNVLTVPLADHQHTLDINFMGGVRGMLTAYPRFLKQGGGQLVTVCSMTAFIPTTGLASYAASKHALRAFHHAFALEQRNGPVDFTIVHPTATETAMLEREAQNEDTAMAFAAQPVTAEHVGRVVIRAMELRRLEVFMPESRGVWIRHVGSSPRLMRKIVDARTETGLAALAGRHGANI